MSRKRRIKSMISRVLIFVLLLSAVTGFNITLTSYAQTTTKYQSKIAGTDGLEPDTTFSHWTDTGGGQHYYVGKENSWNKRIYMDWSLGGIPSNAHIAKATLKITQWDSNPAKNIDLYVVASDWNQSTITHNNAPTLGDYVGNVSFGSTHQYQIEVDVTDVVRQWITGEIDQYGLCMKSSTRSKVGSVAIPVKLEIEYYTAPTVTLANTISAYNGDEPLIPSIFVRDTDNETLSCRVFLNSETTAREEKIISNSSTQQEVIFSGIDISGLSEGNHTLKYVVDDGVTSPVEKIFTFLIDKSGPVIVSLDSAIGEDYITISSQINSVGAGLDGNPYRITLGNDSTTWINTNEYTFNNLQLNTSYDCVYEVKDEAGNVTSQAKQIATMASVPRMELHDSTLSSIELSFIDSNPIGTEVQIMETSTGKYVSSSGQLSTNPSWLSLNSKRVDISGLDPDRIYTFKAMARNWDGIETQYSDIFSAKSLNKSEIIYTPEFSLSEVNGNIKLSFDDSNDSKTLYKVICGDKHVNQIGALVEEPVWLSKGEGTILINEYEYNKSYGIRVIARNSFGKESSWSEPAYITIDEPVPLTPDFTVETKVGKDEVYLVWTTSGYDVNYELEVDGLVIDTKYNRTFSHDGLNPDTTHSYRIRAYNNAGYSPWSDYIYKTTEITEPTAPGSVDYTVDNDSAIIKWDYDPNITHYTVEFDGVEYTGIKSNFFEMTNLEPKTAYDYKIKASNGLGESEYGAIRTVTTLLLETPKVVVDEDTYLISWQTVEGANGYTVDINGALTEVTNNYASIDPSTIMPNSTYSVKVQAKDSNDDKSAWSEAYIFTTPPVKPDLVTEIKALTLEDTIQISWKEVNESVVTSYDIMIDSTEEGDYEDGILIENGLNEVSEHYQMYTHDNVEPYSLHNYRIRANTDLVAGDWSSVIEVTALAGLPLPPKNVKLDSVGKITTITWDDVPGATAYEVHIYELNEDGASGSWQTHKVSSPQYVHRGTTLGVEELYQVRTINALGTGEWSGYIVNNSMRLQSIYAEEVDLNLTASNILDFSPYTLHVYYNADVLTVRDLCGKTPIFETEAGLIMLGEDNIEITKVEEGHITFTVDKEIELGYTWEGIINNIIFEGNISGGTTLDYTVFVDDEITWEGY